MTQTSLQNCFHYDIVAFRERESPVDKLDCYRMQRLEEFHHTRTLGTMMNFCVLKPVFFVDGKWHPVYLAKPILKNWSNQCCLVESHEPRLVAGDRFS